MAIPAPLIAGPMSKPMFVVLWIRAFAPMSWDRDTIKGTDDDNAGPKIVETIDVAKTNRYRRSRESSPNAYRSGISKTSNARIQSTQIITGFFRIRSKYTPMRGPNTNGGIVWSKPMTVILNAEPVNSYTNQRSATLFMLSPI